MKSSYLYILLCSLFVVSAFSCGKVSQEVGLKNPEDLKTFDLTFKINVLSTKDIKIRQELNPEFTPSSDFTVGDSPIYVQVIGYKGKSATALSWARTVLQEDLSRSNNNAASPPPSSTRNLASTASVSPSRPSSTSSVIETRGSFSQFSRDRDRFTDNVPPTTDTATPSRTTTPSVDTPSSRPASTTSTGTLPQYKSHSYNSDGLEITTSQYQWATLRFNSSKYMWEGTAKKLKADYDHYLVATYTGESLYALRLVDQETTSGNAAVSLGEITPYETFLATLFLTQVTSTKNVSEAPISRSELVSLYSSEFYELSAYQSPKISTPKFDLERPVFKFNRQTEVNYNALLSLYLTDLEEALIFVQENEKKLFSKKTRSFLTNKVEKSLEKAAKD